MPDLLIPLVTVITPCYNGELFIRACVESVRQQNYNLEHIVVDDASTDNSWPLLLELSKQYPWLRPVKLSLNRGPVIARNEAIKLAQGKYLAFLDIDDYWLPEKLTIQIAFMQHEKSYLCFSDYRQISQDGLKIGRRISGPAVIGSHLHHMTRYIGCLTIVLDRVKCPNFCFPSIAPAVRAEDFLAWQDFMIFTGVEAIRCPHDLARYRLVNDSRSSRKFRSSKSLWLLYTKIEKLGLFTALFYFVSYAIFSIWKLYWYRPLYPIKIVDTRLDR